MCSSENAPRDVDCAVGCARRYLDKFFPDMPIPDKEHTIGRGYIAQVCCSACDGMNGVKGREFYQWHSIGTTITTPPQGNAAHPRSVVCFDTKGLKYLMANIGVYPVCYISLIRVT